MCFTVEKKGSMPLISNKDEMLHWLLRLSSMCCYAVKKKFMILEEAINNNQAEIDNYIIIVLSKENIIQNTNSEVPMQHA